jgi:SAM-dependent methyltransferase
MPDPIAAFYDDMAEYQHLVFKDWNWSIDWQSGIFGPLLERALGIPPLSILDCACGIGTQSLGLARRGHTVTGTDLSPAAIARARREAGLRSLSIRFETADMRVLSTLDASGFDAVIAADNALPHLASAAELLQATRSVASKLKPGGLFLASIRDYDQALVTRPASLEPAFLLDDGRRRIVHQVWDWIDDRSYTFHLYITRDTGSGWQSIHSASTYRALRREELSRILADAGFGGIRWLMPAESGFYQPIVLAALV